MAQATGEGWHTMAHGLNVTSSLSLYSHKLNTVFTFLNGYEVEDEEEEEDL